MFNDPPSYRVGEASRANPKGLARLPNIYNSEMYQIVRSHNLIRLVGQARDLSYIKEISFFERGWEARPEGAHFFQGELGPWPVKGLLKMWRIS